MQKKSLIELLHDLEEEMLRFGYADNTMRLYRRRWKRLLRFAEERSETFYSEQLGMSFVEEHFHILEKDINGTLSRSDLRKLRTIRMIGDFQLYHTFSRQYCKNKEVLTEPYFVAIRNRFRLYCEGKGCAKTTIDHYVRQSVRFMDYLASQGIIDCKAINLSLIHAYIKTLAGYAYNSVTENICCMRAFLRFLLEIGEVQTDFATKMPVIQARKQTRIPSVWTKDELKKLIAVIDRGSPKGKRDYAIILLACCLGIRCIDIKNLKMENFHWEQKKLVFIQSRTKVTLSLPLTPEVGWAVIDYLKYGRPKIDSPYLFVKLMAPFGPFAEGNHLHRLIGRYMQSAHLPILKKRRGMHSLRHTLASMLLEKDTPLSTISNVLGHVDTNSTSVYLKVSMQKLKECALTLEEGKDYE